MKRCIDNLPHERNFEVFLTVDEELPPIRKYVEAELCLIVSEAVTNARKHARTTSAFVHTKRQSTGLLILIQDAGVGFDMQALDATFGISGMQGRAAKAGAELLIISAPGRGTEVQIKLC